ncbi:MAG TPA: hypothetical protein VGH02_13975 [Rhizomicrobium sp.]
MRAEYEKRVRDLAAVAERMRRDGADAETIARTVVAERRALAAHYKEMTPEPLRTRIFAHTVAVYSDPLGPTVDYLRGKGRSWEEIIASASRPGEIPVED